MNPDAVCAAQCLIAEDMFQDPALLMPPADERLALFGYELRAYVTAVDAIFRGHWFQIGGDRRFYGMVLERPAAPGDVLFVIRGTQRAIEWDIDGECLLRPFPGGGRAEDGFYGLQATLATALPYVGAPEVPLSQQLPDVLARATHVTVTGHSLGAAMSYPTAWQLAQLLPGKVALRAVAPPRPGDAEMCAAVAAAVPDTEGYAYEDDVVPTVPPLELGYAHPPKLIILPRSDAVRRTGDPYQDKSAAHHALTYAYLLDPAVAALVANGRDAAYSACLNA